MCGEKPLNRILSPFLAGITPACAGKRSICKPDSPRCRDHPRMCGEKNQVKKRKRLRMGSPPHVRGKEFVVANNYAEQGITPACAGKSL